MMFVRVKSYRTARRRYPGAVKILKVEGGYMAFLTWESYETWRKQR